MAITYDDTTIASLPGNIQIDKIKFLSYYHFKGIRKIYYSLVLNFKLENLNKIFPKNILVQKWIELNEHFQFGCANPSMIINKNQGIYATYTDLTNDGGNSTPVIKIVQLNNSRLNNLGYNNNDTIVTISMYYKRKDDLNTRSWSDFEPLIPDLYTENTNSVKTLKLAIKNSAWECLKIGLTQIDNLENPGLYNIELSNVITQSAY